MAKYDTRNPERAAVLRKRIDTLINKGALVDVKEDTDKTPSQNAYFHLIASYFALNFGYTLSHVKEDFIKRDLCADVFKQIKVSKITGEEFIHVRSFSELGKEETSHVIDKFWNYSHIVAEFRLPHPDDLMYSEEMRQVKVEIDKNKQYL